MKYRHVITVGLAAALVVSLGAGSAAASGPRDLPLVRGDKGSTVVKAHERLAWLGYSIRKEERKAQRYGGSTVKAVTSLQNKFFMNAHGKLNRSTWKLIRKVGLKVGKLPRACLAERKTLCIDKRSKLLRYVRNGKVVQTLDVRFGVPGLDTPTGTYRVWYKNRWATSGINGPNQPRAPMPYALFFNGDIAVHYSPTFAANGYYPGGGSHGCVNVRDRAGVAWLFDRIPVGTRVHVYWG
jgi:lipoprotein-anchoring transpeptidase ErfK/SrfK